MLYEVITLGKDVPLHFTAFHPDWKMPNHPPTPFSTLTRARRIAKGNGLHHVYTGNVHDVDGGSTYCDHCDHCLIERDAYRIGRYALTDDGCCEFCGTKLAGVFDGPAGNGGARRQPVTVTRTLARTGSR